MANIKKQVRRSANFKLEIVLEKLRGESIEELSRKHKVSAPEIEDWVYRFVNSGKVSLKSKSQSIEQYELIQAKRIIADQAITIDILKKRNQIVDRISMK